MKKMYLRVISAGLAIAMAMAVLSGCSGPAKESGSETAAEKTEAAKSTGPVTYPLDTDKTLVYWGMLNSNVSANFTNLGDTELAKDWQAQTGVKIEFQHPTSGQDKEQFNLIVADGNYPDLWDYKWHDPNVYPGGAAKAIEDGVIMDLTDLINQYAPNLKAYLNAHPDVDRAVKTDDGKYFAFPSLRENDQMCTSFGPMMRADWLRDWRSGMRRLLRLRKKKTVRLLLPGMIRLGGQTIPLPMRMALQGNLSWMTIR